MKITQLQSNIFEFKNNKYQTQTKRFINFEYFKKEIYDLALKSNKVFLYYNGSELILKDK